MNCNFKSKKKAIWICKVNGKVETKNLREEEISLTMTSSNQSFRRFVVEISLAWLKWVTVAFQTTPPAVVCGSLSVRRCRVSRACSSMAWTKALKRLVIWKSSHAQYPVFIRSLVNLSSRVLAITWLEGNRAKLLNQIKTCSTHVPSWTLKTRGREKLNRNR